MTDTATTSTACNSRPDRGSFAFRDVKQVCVLASGHVGLCEGPTWETPGPDGEPVTCCNGWLNPNR